MASIIPDEAIEAAAKVIWMPEMPVSEWEPQRTWESEHESYKDQMRDSARKILEATAPSIQAQALRDAADDMTNLERLGDVPPEACTTEENAAVEEYLKSTDMREWLRSRAARIEREAVNQSDNIPASRRSVAEFLDADYSIPSHGGSMAPGFAGDKESADAMVARLSTNVPKKAIPGATLYGLLAHDDEYLDGSPSLAWIKTRHAEEPGSTIVVKRDGVWTDYEESGDTSNG